MRSTSAALISLALVAASAPALAVPVPQPSSTLHLSDADAFVLAHVLGSGPLSARELEARISLSSALPFLKELGKGTLVGGAFTALTDFVGGSQPAQRDLSGEEVEMLKRELEARISLSSALPFIKELGKGTLVGGAFTALADLVGGSSQPAQRDLSGEEVEMLKRELEARISLSSALPFIKELGKGTLVGGAFTALADLVGGSSQPAQRDLSGEEVEMLKRELEARISLSSALPFIKELGKGTLVGGAFTALADLVSGDKPASKRELETRNVAGEVVEEGIGKIIGKNAINGIGSALGATAVGELFHKVFGRELSADDVELLQALSELSKREPEPFVIPPGTTIGSPAGVIFPGFRRPQILASRGPGGGAAVVGEVVEEGIGKIIGKNAINGIGSALGATAVGELFNKIFNRELSFGPPPTFDELIHHPDFRIKLRELAEMEAREPLALGSIGKGLLGTIAGLASSTVAGGAIDEIKSLFTRELEGLSELD